MAQGYAIEAVGVLDGSKNPAALADGRVVGGRLLLFQASFDLSAVTVAKNIADTNVCFRIPGDCKPIVGMLLANVTMGATATIAIGNATVPSKYRTPQVFSTADTPTLFMLSSAADDAPLANPETVIMTIGAAALPGAGMLQIFMLVSKV